METNISVEMSDGVKLATDVFLPGGGRAPAILVRTPYGKDLAVDFPDFVAYTRAGYAVVTQDVRGRHDSEGEFHPFRHEADDGSDTISWVAAQPWCSGEVFMVGSSYLGATQWLAASRRPPALTAIAPATTAANYHGAWSYQGGALQLGFLLFWTVASLATGDALREVDAGGTASGRFEELVAAADAIDTLYERLPLSDVPVLEGVAPYYAEWLGHPTYDEYWRATAPEESHRSLAVPSFNVGGWYDIFLGGTLANYVGMKASGASTAARRPRLVIGPWSHGVMSGEFPEQSHGLSANALLAEIPQRQVAFFDSFVSGRAAADESEPAVSIFVMGANEWWTAEDWPLPGTSFTNFYLHGSGRAGSTVDDGVLSADAPGVEPEDVYLYDPRDPVPTVGGQTFLPRLFVAGNAGPRDQRAVEGRRDVLCYTTVPLDRDVTVVGPVELILHAASSAFDTDFTGKLVDVHPDGRAVGLTDGILRARYRESAASPTPLEPGRVYELSIDLIATANVFKAGHRIRLEVSSSNFPRFDRNSNSGGVIAEETEREFLTATNRVYHDRDRPSRLVLPIVGR
jgi:putative CocE/NonD family hydrolase